MWSRRSEVDGGQGGGREVGMKEVSQAAVEVVADLPMTEGQPRWVWYQHQW